VCRFFDREPAERTKFDDLRETPIDRFEATERIIQGKHWDFARCWRFPGIFNGYSLDPLAALVGMVTPCAIDEDAPHDLCGDTEEVRATPPINLTLIDESEIRFVDECRWLESMPRPLTTELPTRDPA
jgi:hypothetical protein